MDEPRPPAPVKVRLRRRGQRDPLNRRATASARFRARRLLIRELERAIAEYGKGA